MKNLYLKIRYRLFKKWLKKKDFTKKELVFSDDFKTLDNFNIKEGFYNTNDVWFSKDFPVITHEGLVINCVRKPVYHESWDGKRTTTWESGMIDTRNKFEHSFGTWVIEANAPDSWPALWLLKVEHNEPGYTRHQITPEVDIMEIIKGKYRSTVHWGYSDTVYRRFGDGSSISKCDGKMHQFAAELLPNGYRFYIDGILVSEFKKKHDQFVTSVPNYLVINNAVEHKTNKDFFRFVMKSVKVYK